MFQWATSKLAQLSETLAPPPSTPSNRFLSALSQNDENAALAILRDGAEPFDVYASLNNRGMSSLHVAASYGAWNTVKEVLSRGVRVDLTDYNGWSALHHAASGTTANSLPLVKYLVEECQASILLKTNDGATAYDVASSQAVRGYLLPRQLQLETKECLDNGGKGLMPGIDLGGCRVNYTNLAPPPVIGGTGPPPMAAGGTPMQNSSYDPSAALMQPPPVRGIGMAPSPRQPPHGVENAIPLQGNYSAGGAYPVEPLTNVLDTFAQTQSLQQWQNPPVSSDPVTASPSPQVTQQQQQQREHQQQHHWQPPAVSNEASVTPSPHQVTRDQNQELQQPPTQSSQPEPPQPQLPQPPRSNNSQFTPSSYALRGGNANAASILDESKAGRKIYKPDGFHSSSNDKELQAKYGHVENEFEKNRKAAVPPPPVSGGAPLSSGAGMANAPPLSGGYNPYSAGRPTSGYIGGSGRARYPTYCPVSNSVSAPPSLSGAGFGYGSAPVPVYANFYQGGFSSGVQQQQQHGAVMQQNQPNMYGAGYSHQTYMTAPDSSVPPPAQQQQQHWTGEMQQNQQNIYGAGYNQHTYTASPDSNIPAQVQQIPLTGAVQGNQAAGAFSPSSNHAHSAGYTQESNGPPALQEQQHRAVHMQQIQSSPDTYSSPLPAMNVVNDNEIPAADQNTVNHVHDCQQFSPSVNTSKTPPPPTRHQSQAVMAADAAANMFGTPHADTPTKPAVFEDRDSLPLLPVDSSNAEELFSSPPLNSPSGTPAKSNAAADHFASPASSTQPATADNPVTHASEPLPDHSGSFVESPPRGESNLNSTSAAYDASSFFCGGEKNAGDQTVEKPHTSDSAAMSTTATTPTAARLKSFGGLPPPPVIGGMTPVSTPRSFVSSRAGSSLPPPPVARSSLSNVKEEDIVADQFADVSLS
ncbi:hypothetical protein ACHAW6_008224 [Cyclotella cf. meneghiniana]